MDEFPDQLRELFQRAILNDSGVYFAGGGHDGGDEDGWERYHVEITKAPVAKEVQLHVMHLTIAHRIARLANMQDIHAYAAGVAAEWNKLATEVKGLSYAEWRQRLMGAALEKLETARARTSTPRRPASKSKGRARGGSKRGARRR